MNKKVRFLGLARYNGHRIGADEFVEERQRLADAVKHHQRDRNRAPSEPAGEYSSPTNSG